MPRKKKQAVNSKEIALGRLNVLEQENKTLKESLAKKESNGLNLDLIRKTYAKDATDEEFRLFAEICRLYSLNPIKREIFFTKFKSHKTGETTMAIVVGRDGYLTIAHKSPSFDGLSSGVIEKDGKLWGAYCEVFRKDWTRPIRVESKLSEYNTGRNLWATMPATMILKVAESQALRKAFNVSGVYSGEELEQDGYGMIGGVSSTLPSQEKPRLEATTKPDEASNGEPQAPKLSSEDQLRIKSTIKQICQTNQWEQEAFVAKVKEALQGAGYSSLADVPQFYMNDLFDIIGRIKL